MNILKFDELYDKLHTTYAITYVGIGSACYNKWSSNNDQQYPEQLKIIKNTFPQLHINLILIDPSFADIHTITCLHEINAIRDNTYSNFYHSDNDLIRIFIFDQYVTYIPDICNEYIVSSNTIDITHNLERLNMMVNKTHILLVHDFSGLRIDILATYFDKSIDHEHIMYDLSGRINDPCITDFKQMPYCIIINNDKINIFNPFGLNSINLRNTYYNSDNNVVKLQIKTCSEFRKRSFIYLYFNNFRRICLWNLAIINHDKDVNTKYKTIQIKDMMLLDRLHNTQLTQLYEKHDSYNCSDVMNSIFIQQCQNVADLFEFNVNHLTDIIKYQNNPNFWLDPITDYVSNIHF